MNVSETVISDLTRGTGTPMRDPKITVTQATRKNCKSIRDRSKCSAAHTSALAPANITSHMYGALSRGLFNLTRSFIVLRGCAALVVLKPGLGHGRGCRSG